MTWKDYKWFIHPSSTGDENTSMGTTASSIPMGPKDFPGKDSSDPYKQHPTSSSKANEL